MRRILLLVPIVLLAACGASSGTSGSSAPSKAPLQAAKDTCAANVSSDTDIGDGGKSLTMHLSHYASYTASNDPTVLTQEDLVCILDAVNTPDYVRSQISETRALDGMQNATWQGFRAQWTYHPDAGLNMTLIQQ